MLTREAFEPVSIQLSSHYTDSFALPFAEIHNEALPNAFYNSNTILRKITEDETNIEIDWNTKQVLTNTDHLNIDMEIRDHYEIVYTVPHYQERAYKFLFDKMIDADGNVYYSNSSWHTKTEEHEQIGQTFEVVTPPVNPVKLRFSYDFFKIKPQIKFSIPNMTLHLTTNLKGTMQFALCLPYNNQLIVIISLYINYTNT